MRDSMDFAIGILSVTAAILLIGLLFSWAYEGERAYAFGQIDRGGDYIMVTGQFTENSELIYLTDAAALRLNSYSFEPTTNRFVLWESIDLTQFREQPARR